MDDSEWEAWANTFPPSRQTVEDTDNGDYGNLDDQSTLVNTSILSSPQSATSARSSSNSISARQTPLSPDQDTSDPLSGQQFTPPSQRRSHLWKAIIAMPIVILLLAWYLRSDIRFSGGLKCKQVSSPNGELAVIPQLHPIDTTAHEAVGRQLGDERILDRLIQSYINGNGSIGAVSLAFVGDFACFIKDSPTIHGDTVEAFLKQVAALLDQLESITSNLSYIFDLYLEISPAYSDLRLSAGELTEVVTSIDYRTYAVTAKRLYEDADRGVNALEKELARLEEVQQVFRQHVNSLQRFLIMPIGWLADLTDDRNRSSAWCQTHSLDQRERPKQGELKNGFRQDIGFSLIQGDEAMKQQRFERWWAELGCQCEASR